jgi:hypothetical protein
LEVFCGPAVSVLTVNVVTFLGLIF